MKQTTIDIICTVAEKEGFTVTISDDEILFSKYSPAGQDFNVSIECIDDEDMEEREARDVLSLAVYERYMNYDVSYEAYLWLGSDGHGKNGAPDDMMDVYNDMKECERYILELSKAFDRNDNENENDKL